MKTLSMKMLCAAMVVLCATPSFTAELQMSYVSPMFRMGSSANDSASTLTATPQLAFPNMTLADVVALIDDGYSFGATQCGTSWGKKSVAFHAKDVIVCRNPETDAVTLISVLFVFYNDRHTKSFALELTDGEGGVYAKAGRAQYLYRTNNTSFQFVIPDGNGGVIYSCDTSDSGKASGTTIATYDGSGYGFCSLTFAKVPKTSAKTRVFANASGEPALTVQDIRDYSFSSRLCGLSIGIANLGAVANGYNTTVTEDGEGRATKLTVDFEIVEGGYTKCVVVDFTDGDDGVYAQTVKGLYASPSTLPLGSPSTSEGWNVQTASPPEYYGYTYDGTTSSAYGLFTMIATPPAQPGAYKMLCGSNQHVLDPSTLPLVADSWVRVFDGVSLQDIADGPYELSCWMCGGSIGSKQRVLAKGIHYFTPEGETSVSNALCTFVVYDDRHTKAATVLFENRADGVYAKYGKGQYLYKKNNVSFNFAWLDEETGEPVYDCDQESHTATYSASVPTTWTASGYGVAGLAAHKYMAKNVSNLVWANPAGEPVLTLDDIKDHYFGCYCSGANFSTKDREGIGLHRTFEYDQSGSVTSMRVEFQTYDHIYAKCVVVDFTNGVDGVYGTAVTACHSSGNYGHVGYPFYNASGALVVGEDTVATNTAVASYGIYELFAAPMVTLTRDTDWSGRGSALSLGGAVVNLNGYRLTVDGLSGDATAYAKIVNTNVGVTAELRVKPSSWQSFANDSVCFGKSALDTHNIKFVKDGKGAYSAAVAQEYKGTTELVDGILKVGIAGTSKPFGTATTTITIPAGCVFDANGKSGFGAYSFVLSGGTIRSSATGSDYDNGFLKNVSLTADSAIEVLGVYGVVGDNYSAASVDLGGHTLSASLGSGFVICNTTFGASGGVVELVGDNYLQSGRNINADSLSTNDASTVDFRVNCRLNVLAPLNVHDYVALYGVNANLGTEALNVFGAFRPSSAHDYFHGCRMMDGATIDLSARAAALPLVSAFTNENSDRTLKFADGATVYVKLDGQRFPQGKVIAWESMPENIGSVKFRSVAGERKCAFVAKDDGLYMMTGFMLLVK